MHINYLLNCYQFEDIALPSLEGHSAEPFGVNCDRFALDHLNNLIWSPLEQRVASPGLEHTDYLSKLN